MTTETIDPEILQHIKRNTQMTGSSVILLLVAIGIVTLSAYAIGALNLHDALGSAIVALVAMLLADRLEVMIFIRTLPKPDVAHLLSAHRRVAVGFALSAVPLMAISHRWSDSAQSALEKTGCDLVTILAGILIVSAIRLRKPDQKRLKQNLDLLRTLPSATEQH